MTKLTDALRRLAEDDPEEVGEPPATTAVAAAVAPAVAGDDIEAAPALQPVAELPPTLPAPVVVETRPPPRDAPPDAAPAPATAARPDVLRLRDFVADHARPEPGRGGSVLFMVTPDDMDDDARRAASLLVGELAGALANRPGDDVLVLEVPPAGQSGPSAREADLALDTATIADLIRTRPRLTDLIRPDDSIGAWRAAGPRLPLRSPPAPWPALAALVGECRQHFAWTLVDGGRWDPVESAELARRSDSVYLVLHEGRTGRIAARRLLGELRRAGASVACCLLVGRAPGGASGA